MAGALTALGLVTVIATLSAFVRTLRTPVAPATRLPAPWALLLPLVVLALLAAARRVSPADREGAPPPLHAGGHRAEWRSRELSHPAPLGP